MFKKSIFAQLDTAIITTTVPHKIKFLKLSTFFFFKKLYLCSEWFVKASEAFSSHFVAYWNENKPIFYVLALCIYIASFFFFYFFGYRSVAFPAALINWNINKSDYTSYTLYTKKRLNSSKLDFKIQINSNKIRQDFSYAHSTHSLGLFRSVQLELIRIDERAKEEEKKENINAISTDRFLFSLNFKHERKCLDILLEPNDSFLFPSQLLKNKDLRVYMKSIIY
jgi:hypothetical protein